MSMILMKLGLNVAIFKKRIWSSRVLEIPLPDKKNFITQSMWMISLSFLFSVYLSLLCIVLFVTLYSSFTQGWTAMNSEVNEKQWKSKYEVFTKRSKGKYRVPRVQCKERASTRYGVGPPFLFISLLYVRVLFLYVPHQFVLCRH